MSNGHCYGSPPRSACGVKQKRIHHPAARETQIRHLQKRFGLSLSQAALYADLHFGGHPHEKC